jgi:hypothetical protein
MRARRVVKIEELAASQRDFGLMSTAKLRSRLWPLKVPLLGLVQQAAALITFSCFDMT